MVGQRGRKRLDAPDATGKALAAFSRLRYLRTE